MRPIHRTGSQPCGTSGHLDRSVRPALYEIIRRTPVRITPTGREICLNDERSKEMTDAGMKNGIRIEPIYMRALKDSQPMIQDILIVEGFEPLSLSWEDARHLLNLILLKPSWLSQV